MWIIHGSVSDWGADETEESQKSLTPASVLCGSSLLWQSIRDLNGDWGLRLNFAAYIENCTKHASSKGQLLL